MIDTCNQPLGNMDSLSKEYVLARHQNLVLNPKLENGTPSEKADILRNIITNLQCSKDSDILEQSEVSHLQQEYEDQYTNIVDTFDEQTGLNNFAAGALAICSGNRNESQAWKSSLTLDKVKTLPCVQAALRRAQILHKPALGGKNLSDPLPSRPSLGKENLIKKELIARGPDISVLSSTGSSIISGAANPLMNLYPIGSTVPIISHQGSVPVQTGVSHHQGPQHVGFRAQEHGQCDLLAGRQQSAEVINRKPFSSGGRNQNLFKQPSHMPYQQQGHDPSTEETEEARPVHNAFRTAKQQLDIDKQKKYGGGAQSRVPAPAAYGTGKKSLGTRRGLNSKFVPPVMNREEDDLGDQVANVVTRAVLKTGGCEASGSGAALFEGIDEEKLKGIEPKMVELIMNEIMDSGPPLTWDDVAGLEFAKKTIKEIVVWPMLRPDIFTGLRGPPKGLLLFGPPGTGKTLIGKCIACQSKSTFFCISASSLTSKWVGEGEKMVRALFAVARARQPAVVFIDEIDSLLTQRTDGENEASRRIKTEFLVQLDGASTSSDDRILVIGATNRPQEIDEAARRRFVKRLYIPLPETEARRSIITNLLRQQEYALSDRDLDHICTHTDGFSGADMATLCREAALGPIRDMSFGDIENIAADQVRAITFKDFEAALRNVKPSVSQKDLDIYIDWNNTFGSGSR
ncbi:fidgetin-like protein 1 isoform X2 [Dreissena polymorpha]|uniref:fidgetin-like protein 1 isoform X2 n=1 Tax=Dreissena polymorpha TaxID=45954 RepID=UPI002264E927|nr:fidgetin-like protein 1 isoform X2 [Dreissena polymorpha]